MGTRNSTVLDSTIRFGSGLRHNDFLRNPISLIALATLPFVVKSTAEHLVLDPHPKRTKTLRHPTLVIPGITKRGKDMTTFRNDLRGHETAAHIWGPDRNNGPTRFATHKLETLLNNFHNDVGEEVYIAGYSFGGLMALYLARLFPEKVRAIFLLASPDLLGYGDISDKTIFKNHFKYIDHAGFLFDQKILKSWIGEHERTPLAVPIIAFVACNDKTVSAPACEAPEGPMNRTFYIDCDHTEMKTHKGVAAAIAYLQENGLDAELPQEILDTGFVNRDRMIDHFPTIDDLQNTIAHPPLALDIGVLSYS